MSLEEIKLSKYGLASRLPSPVNRMMASFSASFRDGLDINLGVGYVNERTMPARDMAEALFGVLKDPARYRLPFNYGGPRGSTNLIHALRRHLLDNHVGGLTAPVLEQNEIIIGPSGATSLLEAMGQVMEKGIVITTDPMYYIYCEYLHRAGFELLAVPEDEEGIRLDLLEETLASLGERRDAVRFIYVVTVNNPSCTILSNARRKHLVKAVSALSRRAGRKIPLILDRAYEDLIHAPGVPPPESALGYDEDGLVYEIGTLSKVLAPALRIGYLVGSPGPLLDTLIQKTSDTGFSAPVINQEIAAYMLEHHMTCQLQRVRAGYREKAVAVRGWIEEYLFPLLTECRGGQAGFYFYLTFRRTDTREGSPFFRYLARTTGDEQIDGAAGNRHPRVVYLPGSFCVHPSGRMQKDGQRQLRLSYGFEELEQIRTGIRLMAEASRYASLQ